MYLVLNIMIMAPRIKIIVNYNLLWSNILKQKVIKACRASQNAAIRFKITPKNV